MYIGGKPRMSMSNENRQPVFALSLGRVYENPKPCSVSRDQNRCNTYVLSPFHALLGHGRAPATISSLQQQGGNKDYSVPVLASKLPL